MELKIEGYEEMTVEEKLAALEAQVKDYSPEKEGYVAKNLLDKANSEAAGYKRQLREANAQGEAAQQTQKSLEERVKELEQEKAIGSAMAQFLAIGYNEQLAGSSAKALITGDNQTLFDNQKAFIEDLKKATRVKELENMPRPAAGGVKGGKDYSQLIKQAQERGDNAAVAYYMRLAQTEKTQD